MCMYVCLSVCLSVCLCMYVCMYARTHARTHARTPVAICLMLSGEEEGSAGVNDLRRVIRAWGVGVLEFFMANPKP